MKNGWQPAECQIEAVLDAHPDLVLVGFKLDSGDALIERAKEAMDRYGLAVVVANIMESMGDDGGVGSSVKRTRLRNLGGTKDVIAGAVFDCIERVVGWAVDQWVKSVNSDAYARG